jgi:hypothetical protein
MALGYIREVRESAVWAAYWAAGVHVICIPRMNKSPHLRLLFETHATRLDNEAGLASGSFDSEGSDS